MCVSEDFQELSFSDFRHFSNLDNSPHVTVPKVPFVLDAVDIAQLEVGCSRNEGTWHARHGMYPHPMCMCFVYVCVCGGGGGGGGGGGIRPPRPLGSYIMGK